MSMITTLQQIDKVYLVDSIQSLVSQKVYYNEMQLQFDLAWQIRQDIVVENLEVCLEKLTATGMRFVQNKQKSISWYTDIVVFDKGTGKFIPIELKYKTKADAGLAFKNHGAYDLGCYDFLWDTKRNEILQSPSSTALKAKTIKRESDLKAMVNGFSVIVTNDCDYWKDKSTSTSCAKAFFLDGGKTISKGNALDWDRKKSSATFYQKTWRDMALTFHKDYDCNWIVVPNKGFQFLIFETN